jgi:hypothetical protein
MFLLRGVTHWKFLLRIQNVCAGPEKGRSRRALPWGMNAMKIAAFGGRPGPCWQTLRGRSGYMASCYEDFLRQQIIPMLYQPRDCFCGPWQRGGTIVGSSCIAQMKNTQLVIFLLRWMARIHLGSWSGGWNSDAGNTSRKAAACPLGAVF